MLSDVVPKMDERSSQGERNTMNDWWVEQTSRHETEEDNIKSNKEGEEMIKKQK